QKAHADRSRARPPASRQGGGTEGSNLLCSCAESCANRISERVGRNRRMGLWASTDRQRVSGLGSTHGPLGEETERRQRRRAGAALVWNNRETEMGDLAEIEALFFALIGGSPGAEVVFLNQNLAVRLAAVFRGFHAYFLGTLARRLLDLVDKARDRLRPVKLNDNVLGSVGASAAPARRSGAAASVQHVLDRVSRIL